jgi:hypothetical protein
MTVHSTPRDRRESANAGGFLVLPTSRATAIAWLQQWCAQSEN